MENKIEKCEESKKLPTGKKCDDCEFFAKCMSIMGVNRYNDFCIFEPTLFKEKGNNNE